MTNSLPISPGASRGLAMARAAEAMLRALGGTEVRLVVPGMAPVDATARQLGVAAPGAEEIAFSPVVVRSAAGDRVELLFAASSVAAQVEAHQLDSAEALFGAALQVTCRDQTWRPLSFATEYFAGAPHLYRVTAAK